VGQGLEGLKSGNQAPNKNIHLYNLHETELSPFAALDIFIQNVQ
jgi:hypothetical protein